MKICKIKYPDTLGTQVKKIHCSIPGGSGDSSGQILNKHSAERHLIISSVELRCPGATKGTIPPNDFMSLPASWKENFVYFMSLSVFYHFFLSKSGWSPTAQLDQGGAD